MVINTVDNLIPNLKLTTCQCVFNVRNFQCFLLFLGRGIMFALWLGFSQILIPMPKIYAGEEVIEWSEPIKSLLISGTMFGSLISQIPGGMLACRYGAKYVLLLGILCSTLANLSLPYLIEFNDWRIIMALRVFAGFADGIAQPAFIAFLSKWIPIRERGRMVTFVYSGGFFMNTIMIATSGVISKRFGWHIFFYMWSSIGLIWALMWYFLGYDDPDKHPFISNVEFNYIESSLQEVKAHEYIPFPWKKVIKSKPFYAVLLCQCCGEWTFAMMSMNTARYLAGVFNLSLEYNGFYSSIPIFVRLVASFGYIGIDSLVSSKLKLSRSRKIFNTLGQCGASVGFLILAFMTKDYLIEAVIVMGLCYGLNTATNLGYMINHMDIAPNHAGTLKGINNVAEGLTSILSNNYLGIIVTDVSDQSQWEIVFLTAFVILFSGGLIFLFFGSTKVQDWNYSLEKNKEAILQENLSRMKTKSRSVCENSKYSLEDNTDVRPRSKSMLPSSLVRTISIISDK